MAAGITVLVATLFGGILLKVPDVVSFDGVSSVFKWNPWYLEPEKVRFANVFGSHMVLQKDRINRIWGFADSGSTGFKLQLTISGSNTVSTEHYDSTITKYSSRESKWSVDIKPHTAGGPYSINVTVSGTSVILDDVLFGDVWLCSGQSNMQFTSNMMMKPEEIAVAAKYPNIRVFTAAQVQSGVPLDDLQRVTQEWTRASPESIGGPDNEYFSAVCWEYGRHVYDQLQYPVGLVATSWGGTPIEAWSSPDALSKCNVSQPEEKRSIYSDDVITLINGPGEKSVLYNAMIYPFLQLSITGTVWYQGEQNAGSPIYDCRFHAMIEDWRSKFFSFSGKHNDPSFPFGFVQLAPNANSTTLIGGFPTIRWQQTYDFGYVPNSVMQNVFMAVAIDLPDFSSPYGTIHPRDKKTVGVRLARAGLAVAYKQTNIKFQGPFPVLFKKLEENKLQIFYTNISKIEIRGHFGFQVCCGNVDCKNDTAWTVTKISSADASSVTIQYNCGSSGVNGVRYLWSESPCPYLQCPVYSTDAQLPAPPFVFIDNGTGNIITTRT